MQRDESKTKGEWAPLAAMGQAGSGVSKTRSFPSLLHRIASGVTLIELLCVIVIIGILASLLLPTVTRAYSRARAFAEEMEASEIAGMLIAETRGYCAATPRYRFASKSDFVDKCGLAPKCRDWVQASATEFFPFNHLDPTNKTVLVFHFGRKHANRYAFDIGELCMRPPER